MRIRMIAPLLAAVTLIGVSAFAQQEGAPQGRPGGGQGRGQGGFGGGQGRGGMMGMMGGGELTLSKVPMALLVSTLQLTDDQQAKIKPMIEKLEEERKAARPQFGQGGPGGGGMDREAMMAMMEEMRNKQEALQASEARASRQIEALLTPDQKTIETAKLREWKVIQQMNLPLETAAELKLTPEQITVLEKAIKARPQGPMGGFGGRRGGGAK